MSAEPGSGDEDTLKLLASWAAATDRALPSEAVDQPAP